MTCGCPVHYMCLHCGRCYAHEHKAYVRHNGKWWWRCRGGLKHPAIPNNRIVGGV